MSSEFVAAMEDLLALYTMPYDPRYPTVCLNEKPSYCMPVYGLPLTPGHATVASIE